MTTKPNRVAILYPAGTDKQQATALNKSRYADVAEAFRVAGVEAVGAPYNDAFGEDVRATLKTVGGVLVWYNPIEDGRDRTALNTLLSEISARGAFVSAHPDVISKMGTKEVLYRTRGMGWGCDTQLHESLDALRASLSKTLVAGAPRVLKQIRGQSGDGVWKVELADAENAQLTKPRAEMKLRVRHAKRGAPEETMTLDAFLDVCRLYFTASGAMIDQPFQARLSEGMIRCYVIGDRVEGFGEQLINMLYPAPPGAPASEAPLPGPRLYYPPTRPDFQRLKEKLEREWIGEMCGLLGLKRSELPVLWDADFLYGAKDASGLDSYVLCEINVSSVSPFPPSALAPLVAEAVARLRS